MQVAEQNVAAAENAPLADTGVCMRCLYNISTDTERRVGLSIIAEPLV